jgi:hypothetical protein
VGGDGPSRGSPWTRIAATIGVIASLVGIATGVQALLGDDDSPVEPAAEIRARHVRACVRDHDLTQAVQERDPEPGETEIRKPDPLPGEFPFFEQRTYATCDWPPPPGASPDGYRAITVTTVDGPGEFEATGSTFADRVESRCKVLELDYQFGFMGDFEPLPAIRGRPGQTRRLVFELPERGEQARSDAVAWSPGEGEERSLPFYPARDEFVVLHNNQTVLEDARCVS